MTTRHRLFCSSPTWGIIRILQRLWLIGLIRFTVRARINGQPLRIPIARGSGISSLVDGEPWATRVYAVLLQRFPGTFIDVGVNVGQTLMRVRTLRPDADYVGFEPNRFCVDYLRRLMRLNPLLEAPIVAAGLSDHDGEATLRMNQDSLSDDSASLVEDFRPGHTVHRSMAVRIIRFETAEREARIGKAGIVKIDVEGSEREVLRSMADRINRDRPAVVLEILPVGRATNTDRLQRQQDVEALFAGIGYRLLRLRNMGAESRLERMTGPIGVHDDQRLANFVVVPQEREGELLPLLEQAMAQQ